MYVLEFSKQLFRLVFENHLKKCFGNVDQSEKNPYQSRTVFATSLTRWAAEILAATRENPLICRRRRDDEKNVANALRRVIR